MSDQGRTYFLIALRIKKQYFWPGVKKDAGSDRVWMSGSASAFEAERRA
jgi:hypothetical protein